MPRRKNIVIKQVRDQWVMTYGDMMSLLLTFFVLIVSFSSMQETKFHEAAASLKAAFGVLSDPESAIRFDDPIVPARQWRDDEADLLYDVRALEKYVLDAGLDQEVAVEVRDDGVLFRLEAPFLFGSGTADLTAKPRGVLRAMAGFFRRFPYQVDVEGHTDNVPIRSARYASNWDLSAARAVTVARYFQSLGLPPARIAATGYGEYHPIADNATPEGRARNRRVEVFLHLSREDLRHEPVLPFSASPVKLERVGADVAHPTAEKAPVRPIIDPVTGRLGKLPVRR